MSNYSPLPNGYTQLEYIESTGTQWINTGITNWNQTIEYEIKLGIRQQTGGTTTFWGCFDSWSANGNNTPAISTYASYRVPTNFAAGYAATSGTDIGIANGQTGIFALKGDTISWSEGISAPFDRNKTFTNTTPFHLFSTYYNGEPQEHAAYPLYYAKFWLNGELIRDFVPCKNGDGEIGLWDKVEDKFYGNSGTGTFVAGTEVIVPDEVIDYKAMIQGWFVGKRLAAMRGKGGEA